MCIYTYRLKKQIDKGTCMKKSIKMNEDILTSKRGRTFKVENKIKISEETSKYHFKRKTTKQDNTNSEKLQSESTSNTMSIKTIWK